MKIAIVILNFKGYGDLSDCLASVANLKTKNFLLQTIVVDNLSDIGILSKIKKHFPKVLFIPTSHNLGYAAGNNLGIKQALSDNADFILILNNDTFLDLEMLTRLVETAVNEKTGGIFGPKIYFAKGNETHIEKYKSQDLGKVIWYAGGKIDWQNMLVSHRGVDEVDNGQYEVFQKTDFVTGCSLFVRREVFETVGLFDERYYLYFEDVDYCLRAKKKGYGIYYVPSSVVWHKNAASSGGTGSDLQVYYMTRNRLLIGMKYAPLKTKLALFRECLNLLVKGNQTQKQAIGDFIRNKYGKRK